MTEFNRERAEQLIKEAEARQYSQHELELAKLLKETLGFDLERRAYYDNYKLVKNDWNTLRSVLDKLEPVLKTFRESDHSYDRAPTAEGQEVLDAWDVVSKKLAGRETEITEWRKNEETRVRLMFLESEVRKYDEAHQADLDRLERMRMMRDAIQMQAYKEIAALKEERNKLEVELDEEREERMVFSVGCSRLERLHDQLRGYIVEKGLIEDFDNRYPRDEKSNR